MYQGLLCEDKLKCIVCIESLEDVPFTRVVAAV